MALFDSGEISFSPIQQIQMQEFMLKYIKGKFVPMKCEATFRQIVKDIDEKLGLSYVIDEEKIKENERKLKEGMKQRKLELNGKLQVLRREMRQKKRGFKTQIINKQTFTTINYDDTPDFPDRETSKSKSVEKLIRFQ